jgi:hypothetical protein
MARGDELATRGLRVSDPVWRRVLLLQDEMRAALHRQVTVSEVLEALIAEHDKALEANPL